MSAVGDALGLGERRGRHGVGRAAARGLGGERAGRPGREQHLQAGDLDARLGPAPRGRRAVLRDPGGGRARRRRHADVVPPGGGRRPRGRASGSRRTPVPGRTTPTSPCGCTTSRAVGTETRSSPRIGRAFTELRPQEILLATLGEPQGVEMIPSLLRLQRPRQSGRARQRGHGRPARRRRGPLARPLVRL